MEYDPLLAKLITWAPDRHTAIHRMLRALGEYSIVGLENNVAFLRELLADPQFCAGRLDTGFVGSYFARRKPPNAVAPDLELAVALAAAAHSKNGQLEIKNEKTEASRWLSIGRGDPLR